MTKKSQARLTRDTNMNTDKKSVSERINTNRKNKNEFEQNNCWNDLQNMYQQMVTLINQHTVIAELAKDKSLITYIVNKNALTINIQSMANDLLKLNGELKEIYSKHNNKHGSAKDPDEMIQCMTIFETYKLFMERHDGVVMPTVTYILDQFHEAERLRDAFERVDKDLTDPNVISDIPYTTSPTTEVVQ